MTYIINKAYKKGVYIFLTESNKPSKRKTKWSKAPQYSLFDTSKIFQCYLWWIFKIQWVKAFHSRLMIIMYGSIFMKPYLTKCSWPSQEESTLNFENTKYTCIKSCSTASNHFVYLWEPATRILPASIWQFNDS